MRAKPFYINFYHLGGLSDIYEIFQISRHDPGFDGIATVCLWLADSRLFVAFNKPLTGLLYAKFA